MSLSNDGIGYLPGRRLMLTDYTDLELTPADLAEASAVRNACAPSTGDYLDAPRSCNVCGRVAACRAHLRTTGRLLGACENGFCATTSGRRSGRP